MLSGLATQHSDTGSVFEIPAKRPPPAEIANKVPAAIKTLVLVIVVFGFVSFCFFIALS